MTYREMLKAVIENEITPEVIDVAKAEIAKLDARNAKRRNTPTKEQKANMELKSKINGYIKDAGSSVTAAQVAGAFEISTQKASALLRQLVESGDLIAGEEKVKGKGAVKVYSPNC